MPPAKYGFKIKILPRERATIIKLRRLGYPINMIAKALGRSTSFVHKTLGVAIERKSIPHLDMRKLPTATRVRCSIRRWLTLMKFMPSWEAFILGEGERPP